MHYDIVNRQGYVIGNAVVLGTYAYYILHKEQYGCAREIKTDELESRFNLQRTY